MSGIREVMSFERNFQRGKVTAATQVFAGEKSQALAGNIAESKFPVRATVVLRNGNSREEPKMPLRFQVWESERKAMAVIEMGS